MSCLPDVRCLKLLQSANDGVIMSPVAFDVVNGNASTTLFSLVTGLSARRPVVVDCYTL